MRIHYTPEQLAYFRRMGKQGGKARAAALTQAQRSAIARKASLSRKCVTQRKTA